MFTGIHDRSDPLSSPNGAGITGGNRVANDVIVAANDSFTVQKVTVPVIYLNGSPTTFNVQFYERRRFRYRRYWC